MEESVYERTINAMVIPFALDMCMGHLSAELEGFYFRHDTGEPEL